VAKLGQAKLVEILTAGRVTHVVPVPDRTRHVLLLNLMRIFWAAETGDCSNYNLQVACRRAAGCLSADGRVVVIHPDAIGPACLPAFELPVTRCAGLLISEPAIYIISNVKKAATVSRAGHRTHLIS